MEVMQLGEVNDHDKNGIAIATARASNVNLCNLCRKAFLYTCWLMVPFLGSLTEVNKRGYNESNERHEEKQHLCNKQFSDCSC